MKKGFVTVKSKTIRESQSGWSRIDTGPPLSQNDASASAKSGLGVPKGFEHRPELAPSSTEGQAGAAEGRFVR
jgi:hypothetical protein